MKAGIKTTEFWIVCVGLLAVMVAGLTVTESVVNYAMDVELLKWWLGLAGAYAFSRGLAKSKELPRVPDLPVHHPAAAA